MTEQTQVVTQAKKPATIRDHLQSDAFKDAVAKALPKHLTPDRFLRVAATALTKTPKLAQCEQASFFNALLSLSQYGLEPDGRRAHLIPYGNQCQLIIDYKGLVELVMRSGVVSKIHADVVCDNDVFEFDMGEVKAHKIDLRKERGAVFATYALCVFKDGATAAAVMSREEVEAIRKRSRSGSNGPWVTDWNEMAKKTAFRRLSKWLPLSSEVRDAVDGDDDVIDIPSNASRKAEPARAEPINPFELPEVAATEGGEA
jgi:recombination protein RecT